jgi:cytochrome P450
MALPPSLPLPAPLQSLLWIRRPTAYMKLARRLYGNAWRIDLMPFSISMFSDPDSIRTIFASKSVDMRAGDFNRILRTAVGESSVLLLDDDEHMRHRKLLLPQFHGERMRLYGETMADLTREVVATWLENQAFSLHPSTQEITLQIILRTVFGAEGAQLQQLSRRLKRMLAVAERRLALPTMIYLSSRPELETKKPWAWLLRGRDRVDELLYRQIEQRRKDPDQKRTDVLAMLMQARDDEGQPMTDRELRDELMTALAAGHETTATALAWAFERILLQPAIYERLRAEVDAAGGVDAPPDKIAALPYLDATVKEVLRLRPVVPVVGRILQRPMTIGGYDLPHGTAIGACIYLAHRNPDVYPDPDTFKPERFLGVPTDPVTWLPFGGGIRRCIGAQFALYEMKIVLATILAECDLELAQKGPSRTGRRAITLWPIGGTLVKARRRQRQAVAAE